MDNYDEREKEEEKATGERERERKTSKEEEEKARRILSFRSELILPRTRKKGKRKELVLIVWNQFRSICMG